MKKLTKLTSLLLAGIMVLALFTACGGTSPQTPEEQKKIDAACNIWRDEVLKEAVKKSLQPDPALRKAAKETGEELAAKGSLITNGTYWGGLDMTVPDGKKAAYIVLMWDEKTPVTYKLDELLEAADDAEWVKGEAEKMREMMLGVFGSEEPLEKAEAADVAAIKTRMAPTALCWAISLQNNGKNRRTKMNPVSRPEEHPRSPGLFCA